MNKIILPAGTINKILYDLQNKDSRSLVMKYIGKSQYVFDDFLVTEKPPVGVDVNLIMIAFELIDYEDLPSGAMPDYRCDGKIIKYTNFFDKKNPNDNLYKIQQSDIHPELFDICSIYIHPQIEKKSDHIMVDLYTEAVEGFEAFLNKCSDKQAVTRSLTALAILDYVETKFKKEKHVIKKIMPTPEQIEQADRSGEKYVSQPVIVKDISIQYIYEPHSTRKYQRHCEAWGVRGHYRHYKSGKVIFIRSHIKGKGRLKDTRYIINGGLI